MNNTDLLIWIHSLKGVGYKTYEKLIDRFESLDRLWEASEKDILHVENVNKSILKDIIHTRSIEYINDYKNKLAKRDINCINFSNENYPPSLRNIYDPPSMLHVKGKLEYDYEKSIAIVGARKATTYGKSIAYNFAKELASYGITIISGMAYGIDSAAHRGAIDGGGNTIAVLGCGLDICYPKSNHKLMKDIVESGAVISEFPIETSPLPMNFPQRNRIISGLSKLILVVEAAPKSGSLITVEHALEQGKDILSIPGSILSSTSQGTNKLIKEGAKPVTSVNDILEEYNLEDCVINNKNDKILDLSDTENSVVEIVKKKQPIYIDLISAILNMKPSELSSIITILELKGIIEQLPGKIIITKN